MSHNWENYGIRFDLEDVAKRMGENASDKRVIGQAPIAVVTDLDKFRAHFGDDVVLGIMDGTSIRVMSQDVGRRGLEAKDSLDTMKAAIYNRLKGVRNARKGGTRVVEVKVHALPDGTTYKGSDLVEYQQMYAAALVESGVPAAVATALASKQTL